MTGAVETILGALSRLTAADIAHLADADAATRLPARQAQRSVAVVVQADGTTRVEWA